MRTRSHQANAKATSLFPFQLFTLGDIKDQRKTCFHIHFHLVWTKHKILLTITIFVTNALSTIVGIYKECSCLYVFRHRHVRAKSKKISYTRDKPMLCTEIWCHTDLRVPQFCFFFCSTTLFIVGGAEMLTAVGEPQFLDCSHPPKAKLGCSFLTVVTTHSPHSPQVPYRSTTF